MAKTISNMLLQSSCATKTNYVPLYFLYKKVPSNWTTDLQNLKLSIHGLTIQNNLLKMMQTTFNWLLLYAG